jgi:hypothetical protein
MLKTIAALALAAGCCLNTWAAIAADLPQPQHQPRSPELVGPSQGIPTTPIPACWIVPISCR